MKLELNSPSGLTPTKAKHLDRGIRKICGDLGIEVSKLYLANLAVYIPYSYDPSNPSVRLRRLLLKPVLRSVGIRCDVVHRFEELADYDNILISHYGQPMVEELKKLRVEGKRIFYDHSENLWGQPLVDVFSLCDAVVCCSTTLANITRNQISPATKVITMPDLVENFETLPQHVPVKKDALSVVWCGMGGNAFLAREIEPIIKELGMTLTIISEWDDADIKWNQDTYLEEMSKFDIAICPQRVELQPAKSNVKATTAMAIGIPIVCSPLNSYLEAVSHGVNGYIASNSQEWRQGLYALQSYDTRVKISKNARNSIQRYTPKGIAREWLKILSSRTPNIAVINNSLAAKYSSYGDLWVEYFRFVGANVDVFQYEEVHLLAKGYDFYFFVEVRYDVNNIADVSPRVLYTLEVQDLNNIPQFDLVITGTAPPATELVRRGFNNVTIIPNIERPPVEWWADSPDYTRFGLIESALKRDWLKERKRHNRKIHTDNINQFHRLMTPEDRWSGGSRDKAHVKYITEKLGTNSRVLDVGSADGWLSLFLACQGHQVSALEFVERGMEWTLHHAERLKVSIDLQKGYIEDIASVFAGKRFDAILAFEILEHLDYRKLPWYLEQMEAVLAFGGKILVSLPKQNLVDNPEHLWTPSLELIEELFKSKKALIEWVDIPEHEVPGNWFIQYQKEYLRTGL